MSWDLIDYGDFLERAAHLFRDHDAVICGEERLSYSQLLVEAEGYADGLAGLGLEPGDRVADIRGNSVSSLVVDYALALGGLIKVPVNARFSRTEVEQLLNNVGARVVLSTSDHAALLEGISEVVPSVELVVADGVAGAVDLATVTPWPRRPRWRAQPGDVLALRFSGGSTGLPKAVIYTHAAQIQASMCYLMQFVDLGPEDVVLLTQPFSHGSSQWVLPAAMTGSALVMQGAFDAGAALDEIERLGVTVVKLVPTMLFRMVEEQKARPRGLASLRLITYGAAPMPEELIREAMDVFGCSFGQTYGSAEASAAITSLPPREHDLERTAPSDRLRSVGRPYPLVDIAIIGPDGERLAPGEVGEVTVRSPMVMPGYWNEPEKTSENVRDGRVHTGDVGYLAKDGYLYLVGRKNDLINSGGYNVYPSEVEQALLTLDEVKEACVVSVPDVEWGERVVAAVVVAAGTEASPADLIAAARGRLAGYKTPKEILMVASIPSTPNGKVDRRTLRQQFIEATSEGAER